MAAAALPEQVGGYYDASKCAQRSACTDREQLSVFLANGARVVNQPSQHLLGITHIAIPDFVETKMSVYDIHESSPSPATG